MIRSSKKKKKTLPRRDAPRLNKIENGDSDEMSLWFAPAFPMYNRHGTAKRRNRRIAVRLVEEHAV